MDTRCIVAPTPTADLDIASCEVPPGDADGFHEAVKALEEAKARLDRYETRWLELEEMKTA